MLYNQDEREKICAHLDAIKAYIEREIQPKITSEVKVDFGQMKTYYHGDREKEFHLYVSPRNISGRIGGLGLNFERTPTSSSYGATAYQHLDYVVGLLQEWHSIKATLHTAVQKEAETRNVINNFEV